MQIPIVMPQLGLTMTEGMVSEWLKKPGDKIEKDEFIVVVSTDKADVEVESTSDGKLGEILVEAGKTVPVGTVIAYVEDSTPASARSMVLQPVEVEGAPLSKAEHVPPTAAVTQQDVNSSTTRGEGYTVSPRARRLAQELGVELSSLKPKGGSSRIIEEDVRKAAETNSGKINTPDLKRRRLIADKMTESVQTIPHFSVSREIDAQPLLDFYKSQTLGGNESQEKVTLTDLFLKTLALALQTVPESNAVWVNGSLQLHDGVDLALAVATERGIVAPVMRNVPECSLVEIATQRKSIVERARSGHLTFSDLEGAVGTLTNLGMYGVDDFQAIITPGQGFVLAIGSLKERAWVHDGALVVRPTFRLNLTMDHRVNDGVVGARVLNRIADIATAPSGLLASPQKRASS
jgi:pyruvate dehydrogenase E2 component (dihydrolipoamide acetyltransferase)